MKHLGAEDFPDWRTIRSQFWCPLRNSSCFAVRCCARYNRVNLAVVEVTIPTLLSQGYFSAPGCCHMAERDQHLPQPFPFVFWHGGVNQWASRCGNGHMCCLAQPGDYLPSQISSSHTHLLPFLVFNIQLPFSRAVPWLCYSSCCLVGWAFHCSSSLWVLYFLLSYQNLHCKLAAQNVKCWFYRLFKDPFSAPGFILCAEPYSRNSDCCVKKHSLHNCIHVHILCL